MSRSKLQFRIHSWWYHLSPVNLFTCGMFLTGILLNKSNTRYTVLKLSWVKYMSKRTRKWPHSVLFMFHRASVLSRSLLRYYCFSYIQYMRSDTSKAQTPNPLNHFFFLHMCLNRSHTLKTRGIILICAKLSQIPISSLRSSTCAPPTRRIW